MTTLIRLAREIDAARLPDVERSAAQRFRELPDLAWIADDEVLPALTHLNFIAAGTEWVADGAANGLTGFLAAEQTGNDLHIWELAVRHDQQGQGVGRRLIEAAADYGQAAELSAATLTTFRDVAWNAPFYGRLGFELLDAPAIGRRLADILAREAAIGLPAARRCAMRLRLSSR